MYTVELAKRCLGCGIEKPLAGFDRARQPRGERPSRGGMGVESRCKVCKAEARKPGIHAERAEKAWLASQGLKRCGRCLRELPLDRFNVRHASKDGLSYRCGDCCKAVLREWRKDNPKGFRRWHDANREHRTAYFRDWSEKHSERRTVELAEWSKSNRGRRNATVAKRNAAKSRATVAWADHGAIEVIYRKAARITAETGVQHHVDHFYPLQGETVCGLHCEANLQILTGAENIRKKNRMPCEAAV